VRAAVAPATDRAAAAERRASTLAGATAIAASLTVSGAGVILNNITEPSWRFALLVVLALTASAFVMSGWQAARALAGWRRWSVPHPYRPLDRVKLTEAEQRVDQAAELLANFAYNWEVAGAKLRAVDSAFLYLKIAFSLLVLLAAAFAVQVWKPGLLPEFL
jgi:hypothetical protein